jgi:hypothetical protein
MTACGGDLARVDAQLRVGAGHDHDRAAWRPKRRRCPRVERDSLRDRQPLHRVSNRPPDQLWSYFSRSAGTTRDTIWCI